jgi:hypothetical protein
VLEQVVQALDRDTALREDEEVELLEISGALRDELQDGPDGPPLTLGLGDAPALARPPEVVRDLLR